MKKVNGFFHDLGISILPRILTQICRDPTAQFYGSCDRNWWHYKIRDFPSIILQQAGYSVYLAADAGSGGDCVKELKALSAQTCRFWNEQGQRHGAFEEYYPYEQGYPPLAFSTLAVAKLCVAGAVARADIQTGLAVASKQLLTRFEPQAANQQVAGTAALAFIRQLAPELVPETDFQTLLDRTFSLQSREGWFPEYDGPDLGYLSVTMDCLWDLFDITGDSRCLPAIHSAFDYLSWFVLGPVGRTGMLNSRNTDYIVPYGITRLALESEQSANQAIRVLHRLYALSNTDEHFFYSVDDRYWCHYIGHSLFRALKLLSSNENNRLPPDQSQPLSTQHNMSLSGHILLGNTSEKSPDVLVAMRKGAVFTAVWPGGQTASDFGWIVKSGKKLFTSHWWSLDWTVSGRESTAECEGVMVAHKEHISRPWKHFGLRVASFFLGHRLIRLLKRLMIFKTNHSPLTFSRRIRCEGNVIIVEDRITGSGKDDELLHAPRASKRHVASADSYHPEDCKLIRGVNLTTDIHKKADETTITMTYEVYEEMNE